MLVMVGQLPNGRTSWTNPIWEADPRPPGALRREFRLVEHPVQPLAGGTDRVRRRCSGRPGATSTSSACRPSSEGRGARTTTDEAAGLTVPVAVISYAFWQRRFGGAADVIGRSLAVERVPFTIVGVTPPGFFGVDVGRTFDVAIPLGTEPLIRGKESSLDRRSTWWLNVMGRLKNRPVARGRAGGAARRAAADARGDDAAGLARGRQADAT